MRTGKEDFPVSQVPTPSAHGADTAHDEPTRRPLGSAEDPSESRDPGGICGTTTRRGHSQRSARGLLRTGAALPHHRALPRCRWLRWARGHPAGTGDTLGVPGTPLRLPRVPAPPAPPGGALAPPGQLPPVYILSMAFYGVEHPFGHVGSPVLVMIPPSFPCSSSLAEHRTMKRP